MKFLVPIYSCLQNHWLGGYRPPDPLSLCPLSSTEFMLRCILEKLYELNLDLHLLLIDVKQACKSINRIYLYETLKEFGIPKKLVNLIKMTLQCSVEKWKFKDSWLKHVA
jgi:hypothetical protein